MLNSIITKYKKKLYSLLNIVVFVVFIAIIEQNLGIKWAIVGFLLYALVMPLFNYITNPELRLIVNTNCMLIVHQLELMIWGHIKDGKKNG